ncbi:MAG: D-3-phosphoglycerate dehydrogenase [Chitinophagaceae bacterium]|nr:MAG: D-3-phosphoglycerate dehydrogenase [Chitinophagaceae bacterium]
MAKSTQTSYPKDKIKILFLENISDAAIQLFRDNGYSDVKKIAGALSEEQLIQAVKDVHILGIRSKTQITSTILQHATKLQAIGCFCIGTNQVDLVAARKKGVVVFNAPYSNTRSVAELVIGASILLIRRILDKNKYAHEGKWNKDAKSSYELRGKTLGIIGYGSIGSQVSILAEALGMKVIFYDIITKLPLGNAVQKKSIKEVVSKSEIITLHIPENGTTKNLINKTNLKYFKKGSILLNYARGEVVDLDALSNALKSGQLSGAGIDVYPIEPEKNGDSFISPLQHISNVLLTPHIGGSTEEAQHNIGEDVSAKLYHYLEMGITTGSMTIPEMSLPPQEGTHRILHIHNNVPGVLSEINSTMSENKINILGQYLKTNDEIGYVVLDLDKKLSKNASDLLRLVKGTIKVRVLY